MSVLLELRQVDKRYGNGTLALQGVDLTIGQRDFVSFLGPSGCGKSTALKLIAGLLDVSAGRIDWVKPTPRQGESDSESDSATDGPTQPVAVSGADHSHEVSFVFQEPTLMPWCFYLTIPHSLQGIPF